MDSSVLKAVGFVHLHVHSAYSLREGALTVETLAKLAQADSMPALAITDTNNLFGALEFSEKLAKSGVQPIIGAQVTVDFADAAPAFWRGVERDNARAPIVLLAQSETGYGNLMRLVSGLWLDPPGRRRGASSVSHALDEAEGLIALTGGPAGPIDRALSAGTWRPRRKPAQAPGPSVSARGSMSRSSATGSTASVRSSLTLIALADRHRLAPGRDQRALFRRGRRDYEAHDALLCVAEGALVVDVRAPAPLARASVQDARGNVRAVRRSSRGDARPASRSRMRCAYRP